MVTLVIITQSGIQVHVLRYFSLFFFIHNEPVIHKHAFFQSTENEECEVV